MDREKPWWMDWWEWDLWILTCSRPASSSACVNCFTNASLLLILHNISRRLGDSLVSISRWRNKWKVGKCILPGWCRIWSIFSETFRGSTSPIYKFQIGYLNTLVAMRHVRRFLILWMGTFGGWALLNQISFWCLTVSHLIKSVNWSKYLFTGCLVLGILV